MFDEISKLKIEIVQCYESKEYINQDLKKVLDLMIDILNSDVFFVEEEEEFKNLLKIENILNNIFDLLDSIKNIEDLWKDYNQWLVNSVFFYNIWSIIQYFDPDYSIKVEYKLDEIWNQIKNQILKWKTDFKLEFVINICFLIFKEKNVILDFLKDFKNKLRNTQEENSINKLIGFITSGIFDIGLLKLMEEDVEISSCLILLLLRFGKKDELNIVNNLIESWVNSFMKKIIKLSKTPEVNSSIRDWFILRLLQIQLNTKIKSYAVYDVDELDFFNLSPRNFERLIFWIFKKNKKWKEVQWRGAGGGEKGKDLLTIKKKNNKSWIIQAKREKNFSRGNFELEFKKVLNELKKYNCEGYQIFLARNSTDDIFNCGEELAEKYKYCIKVKDREDLNFIVKNNPILLNQFFNYPKKTN